MNVVVKLVVDRNNNLIGHLLNEHGMWTRTQPITSIYSSDGSLVLNCRVDLTHTISYYAKDGTVIEVTQEDDSVIREEYE